MAIIIRPIRDEMMHKEHYVDVFAVISDFLSVPRHYVIEHATERHKAYKYVIKSFYRCLFYKKVVTALIIFMNIVFFAIICHNSLPLNPKY